MQHGTSAIAIVAPVVVSANGNGAAVNVREYIGLCLLHLSAVGTAGTTTVSLQHSADGSTNWTDVPNTAFAAVGVETKSASILFNADRFKKFVRAKYVSAGTGSATVAVSLIGITRTSQ